MLCTASDSFNSRNHRVEIEKYITGIIRNHDCQLYAIYANPEHLHFLVSRTPAISEESLANIIDTSSELFINRKSFAKEFSNGRRLFGIFCLKI